MNDHAPLNYYLVDLNGMKIEQCGDKITKPTQNIGFGYIRGMLYKSLDRLSSWLSRLDHRRQDVSCGTLQAPAPSYLYFLSVSFALY